MANVIINDTHLTDIADSIRSKNGTNNKYKPSEMASAIDNITASEDLSSELNTQETLLDNQTSKLSVAIKILKSKASGGDDGYALADSIVERTITEFINPRITTIGGYAFARHSGLVKIDIPNVTEIKTYGFNYCTGLTEIVLPSVKKIEHQSFNSCSKLTKIDAPMLEFIGAHSLTASKLTTLIIRQSNKVCVLENVGALEMTPIAKGEGYVYVPNNLMDSYKTATNWSTFANQIKTLSDLEESDLLLPSEYQQVEYIESSGTQYIDTGYVPNQDTRVITEHFFTKQPDSGGFMYGAGVSATSSAFEMYTWGNNWNSPYGNTNITITPTSSLIVNNKINIDKNKNNITITYSDGTSQAKSCPYITFTAPRNMLLFAINRNDASVDFRADCIQLCYCKIWDGDTVVRELIPCYRKADNEIGMYDLVENKFYTNNGTGTFLKGVDV